MQKTKLSIFSTYSKLFIGENLLLILCILIAFILQQYSTSCGLGLTYDSNNYLHAAESFAKDYSLTMKNGKPLSPYPPLFSILLSCLGVERLFWAKIFNGIFLGITIFCWHKMAHNEIKKRFFKIIYLLVLVFSAPLLLIHSFLWSEPFFLMVLSILFLYLKKDSSFNYKNALVLLIVGILLVLQRRAGIFFLLGIGFSLLLNSGWRKSVLATVLLVLSMLGLIVYGWLIQKSSDQLYEHHFLSALWKELPIKIYQCEQSLFAWFIPGEVSFGFYFLGFLLGLCFLIIFLLQYFKSYFWQMLFYTHFAYLGGILMLRAEYINFSEMERFLAVVYPGVFFIIFKMLDNCLLKIKTGLIQKIIYVCLILWVTYPILRTSKNAVFWHENQCRNLNNQNQDIKE